MLLLIFLKCFHFRSIFCDRRHFLDGNVILLQNGKISAVGKANEMITREKLREIYGDNLCYSKELPYDEVSFKAI